VTLPYVPLYLNHDICQPACCAKWGYTNSNNLLAKPDYAVFIANFRFQVAVNNDNHINSLPLFDIFENILELMK
jgi:hypothetical protein